VIEAVVFDLDGVLIDSETACYRLAADVVSDKGAGGGRSSACTECSGRD
jgi:beta-phosphoglucomutase-like phosphatase (HAD superfamily)